MTGGASGLGRATAKRLVQQGGSVVIADIMPKEEGNQIANEIGGKQAFYTNCDVRSEDAVKEALSNTEMAFGSLNNLVCCAGTAVAFLIYNHKKQRCHEMVDFQRVIDVNVGGSFNCIRLAAGMIARNEPDSSGQRGSIVLTSSVAAFEGQKGQTAYAASKGAICSLVLPTARDLKEVGIRVNAIAPGVFDTPLLANLPEKVKNFLSDQNVFARTARQTGRVCARRPVSHRESLRQWVGDATGCRHSHAKLDSRFASFRFLIT